MPAAKPQEFRRRAVELARQREKPIAHIAHDLGIAETSLRRWMKQDDVDTGGSGGCLHRRAGRAGPVEPETAGGADGDRDPQAGQRLLRAGECAPKIGFRLVRELAEDADLRVHVTVACRVLRVSRSGYYEWLGRAPSARQVADKKLTATKVCTRKHVSRPRRACNHQNEAIVNSRALLEMMNEASAIRAASRAHPRLRQPSR
jgi:transposase-like protein